MAIVNGSVGHIPDLPPGITSHRFLYFSDLLKRPVCAGKIQNRIGRLTDLVAALKEPYPDLVGILIDHGWGKPNEVVPWDRVVKIEDDAVFILPAEGGGRYPPFVDQPGWILLDNHLMGRTILDMDGRRTEVVNDIHLLEAKGRMLVVHVDISFNGFLRKWGLGRLNVFRDQFISWKYVQPLSVEDAVHTDKVSLSVTRRQIHELPGEDLADALEELSGKEQEALFSALETEKAAETLIEAEPRVQRQIISGLRQERARNILSERSVPQLAALLPVLPHDHATELMKLLPPDLSGRLREVLSEQEVTAGAIMSGEFVAFPPGTKAGQALAAVRVPGRDPGQISYLYVVGEDGSLQGVVDIRELLLSSDEAPLAEIMVSPVVSADEEDTREDLVEIFARYHYRTIPVVNAHDQLRGVIYYSDIMKGLVTRVKV
jgi:magnesium transporter